MEALAVIQRRFYEDYPPHPQEKARTRPRPTTPCSPGPTPAPTPPGLCAAKRRPAPAAPPAFFPREHRCTASRRARR